MFKIFKITVIFKPCVIQNLFRYILYIINLKFFCFLEKNFLFYKNLNSYKKHLNSNLTVAFIFSLLSFRYHMIFKSNVKFCLFLFCFSLLIRIKKLNACQKLIFQMSFLPGLLKSLKNCTKSLKVPYLVP